MGEFKLGHWNRTGVEQKQNNTHAKIYVGQRGESLKKVRRGNDLDQGSPEATLTKPPESLRKSTKMGPSCWRLLVIDKSHVLSCVARNRPTQLDVSMETRASRLTLVLEVRANCIWIRKKCGPAFVQTRDLRLRARQD